MVRGLQHLQKPRDEEGADSHSSWREEKAGGGADRAEDEKRSGAGDRGLKVPQRCRSSHDESDLFVCNEPELAFR